MGRRLAEIVKLSKRLSFLLRHHPEKLGLKLDEEGYTTITVDELAGRMKVSPEKIRRVVATDPKDRFDIRNGRIRANFGHSIDVGRKMYERRRPASGSGLPAALYHGTRPSNVDGILREGLVPKGRQYVHLSTSPEWARRVGSRHARRPAILRIDVANALEQGVRMWTAGPATVLSTRVPPGCLERHS